MRKVLPLPIHVQLALLDRDYCWPSFAGCLVIWVGPNPHLYSNKARDLLDEQLNRESQGSDILKLQWLRRHGNQLSRVQPAQPRSAADRKIYLTFRPGYPSWPRNFAHLRSESRLEIAWLNESFRRSRNLAWRHQEMEKAYDEFCSNNRIALTVQNVFTSRDAACLVITSIRSCTCLFQAIQKKIQETTSCPSPSNKEDSPLYDNILQGMNVWDIQQEKEEKDNTHRHTHTQARCSCRLPPQTSFVPIAAIACCSPRSPLSSRPLLSLHSFFQNLSRFFNSACVWADVQKTSLQQPGGRKFLQFNPGSFPPPRCPPSLSLFFLLLLF